MYRETNTSQLNSEIFELGEVNKIFNLKTEIIGDEEINDDLWELYSARNLIL